MSTTADELRDEVRRRYAESARAVTDGSAGCGSGSCCADDRRERVGSAKFGEVLYDAEQRGELPDAAVLRRSVAAIQRRWPICTRAKRCSTSDRVAVST